MNKSSLVKTVVVLVGILLSLNVASVSAVENNPDPLEGFNRAVFSFNDTLDKYVLKPVAKGYVKITPSPVQDGLGNFFSNIGEISTIANGLLQAKFAQAGLDSTRFLVNTTVGLVGFIDVASRIGLEKHDEDFGQTLGYWGVKSGPYLVLPLLGPSTLRDSVGLIPDQYISPYNTVDHDLTRYSIRAVDLIDLRASLLDAEKLVAGDKYTFFRNAYLQRREFLVNDGELADDFLEDDLLFEDDFEPLGEEDEVGDFE